MKSTNAYSNVLFQLTVTCKIVVECACQTFVHVDSEALRDSQLREPANRFTQT